MGQIAAAAVNGFFPLLALPAAARQQHGGIWLIAC
jgi:hypothetical protein